MNSENDLHDKGQLKQEETHLKNETVVMIMMKRLLIRL